jgi:hypothetical protein
MAEYFNYFEKIPYFLDDEKKNLDLITNLSLKFKFDDNFKENKVIFYNYVVGDGETPEIVSYKFYGTPEKHWIILSLNNIIHPQFDWPLPENNLKDYIDKKYKSFTNTEIDQTGEQWAKTNIKDYFLITTTKTSDLEKPNELITLLSKEKYDNTVSFTQENYILDSGDQVEIKKQKSAISFYDYEIQENDRKRNIKILKNEFSSLIFEEFKNII